MREPRIRMIEITGYPVTVNDDLGLLSVRHYGGISWDTLQRVKNAIWGPEARAIEVYPAQSAVVNTLNERHLWRLGDKDFCPDLLGPVAADDTLKARYVAAWSEAG